MVLIYSHTTSPRLQYTCNFIFKELLGVDFAITINPEEFKNYDGVKINYSKGTPSSWFIYPNPAEGNASLVYQSTTSKIISLNITDITGKIISTSAYNIVPGNNKITVPAERISSGMYIIKIVSEGKAETAAFIKK